MAAIKRWSRGVFTEGLSRCVPSGACTFAAFFLKLETDRNGQTCYIVSGDLGAIGSPVGCVVGAYGWGIGAILEAIGRGLRRLQTSEPWGARVVVVTYFPNGRFTLAADAGFSWVTVVVGHAGFGYTGVVETLLTSLAIGILGTLDTMTIDAGLTCLTGGIALLWVFGGACSVGAGFVALAVCVVFTFHASVVDTLLPRSTWWNTACRCYAFSVAVAGLAEGAVCGLLALNALLVHTLLTVLTWWVAACGFGFTLAIVANLSGLAVFLFDALDTGIVDALFAVLTRWVAACGFGFAFAAVAGLVGLTVSVLLTLDTLLVDAGLAVRTGRVAAALVHTFTLVITGLVRLAIRVGLALNTSVVDALLACRTGGIASSCDRSFASTVLAGLTRRTVGVLFTVDAYVIDTPLVCSASDPTAGGGLIA